jgi:hypothetical protein
MRHRIEAGEDPFVVFVADAPDGRGDLWAMHAGGGESVQLTFSLPAESAPVLSTDGDVIAFLRARSSADTVHRRVWLMNLLNGAERELELPEDAGVATAVSWAGRGRLAVRTTDGTYLLDTPPAPPAPRRVSPAESASVDSAFTVFAGDPPFARIERCAEGEGLCVRTDSGVASPLAPAGRQPIAWGPDSVGYLEGADLVVRPVGPGRARRARLPARLDNAREFTAFLGRRAGQVAP